MIEWYYYIFIREANMDQTPFKKIIKISSFFFLALVTYLIYYPTISPEPAKREGISKNHSRTESEDRYRIGVSQVNDFQKIGNIALAIDKFGEVQEKDGYLVAQNYKLPEDPYPDEGKAFYDKKNTEYFYQIDIYKEDEGIQSLKKVDVRALLLKEKKKYNIKSTAKLDVLDSSPDAPYIEIALEEIDGDSKKASLIIDLKTAKSRIAHYIGAAQEEVLTASDNSELKIAQSNPIFADRLKSLSFIVDAKKDTNPYDNQEKQNQEKIIMMRPYQGGDLINLYQEYPHALEMAKKGSFAIYPLFKYTKDSTQQASDFASLFNYPGEAPFWSAQKKQEYEAEQIVKQKKSPETPLPYDLFIKKVQEEGKINWAEGIVPIGLDIDSEEVVTVDFKKGPVYTQHFDLYDHISALGSLTDLSSTNTMLNQVSFDKTRRYGLKTVKDVSTLIDESKRSNPAGPQYINWLQYNLGSPLSETYMNTVKEIVEQGPLYRIFSIFSLEVGQMTVSQAETNDNLVAGSISVMVQNGNQALVPLQFKINNFHDLTPDKMIKSGRIIYVLIDGQLRRVKVPEER